MTTKEFSRQIVETWESLVPEEDRPMYDWLRDTHPQDFAEQLATTGWDQAREYFANAWVEHQKAQKETSYRLNTGHDWDRRELLVTLEDSEHREVKVRWDAKTARRIAIKLLTAAQELE